MGAAYLPDGMRNAEQAIAGHERLHALEQSNPELGAKLRALIRSYMGEGVLLDRQASEFVASSLPEVSLEQAETELITDINGVMWMGPGQGQPFAVRGRRLQIHGSGGQGHQEPVRLTL